MAVPRKVNELADTFSDQDLQWRVQNCGFKKDGNPWATIIAYVDSRAIMDRLDQACGPGNWKDEYFQWTGGVKCRLWVKVENKSAGFEWVFKEDGSENTNIEAFKGGFSKALVRTAVKWGIGRYLYSMPTTFARFVAPGSKPPEGAIKSQIKDKKTSKEGWHYWVPPRLGK